MLDVWQHLWIIFVRREKKTRFSIHLELEIFITIFVSTMATWMKKLSSFFLLFGCRFAGNFPSSLCVSQCHSNWIVYFSTGSENKNKKRKKTTRFLPDFFLSKVNFKWKIVCLFAENFFFFDFKENFSLLNNDLCFFGISIGIKRQNLERKWFQKTLKLANLFWPVKNEKKLFSKFSHSSADFSFIQFILHFCIEDNQNDHQRKIFTNKKRIQFHNNNNNVFEWEKLFRKESFFLSYIIFRSGNFSEKKNRNQKFPIKKRVFPISSVDTQWEMQQKEKTSVTFNGIKFGILKEFLIWSKKNEINNNSNILKRKGKNK